MKLKRKNYNLLKSKIITEKTFKLYSTEFSFQILKFQNLEFQLKQLAKVFFSFLLKNIKLKSFLFFNFFRFTSFIKKIFKKTLLNFSFLKVCVSYNFVTFQNLLQWFKADFFSFNLFFYLPFFKKYQKSLAKVFSNLTTFLFTKNTLNLKKLKHFYAYGYLIFWAKNSHFFFKIYKGLIYKVFSRVRVLKKRKYYSHKKFRASPRRRR